MSSTSTRPYSVAFSFASPQHAYVAELDVALQVHFPPEVIFLYSRHIADNASPNLDDRLQAIYGEQAEVIVVCLSADYVTSKWAGVEGRCIKKLIFAGEGERIVPVRFDLTPVPQIADYDAYLDVRAVDKSTIVRAIISAHRRVTAPDWRRRPAAAARPSNLPLLSLGSLFKGREDFLADLHARFAATPDLPRVLFGLGGIGKTRLALEHAYRHGSEHSALLFVIADSPAALEANLAALAHPRVLNLEEHHSGDMDTQAAAVLRWLAMHPGWLLIIDNVDTDTATQAVQSLLAQLRNGQVLITSRVDHWSRSVEKLNLDVLSREAAAEFLLERTAGGRIEIATDAQDAGDLADELGGLALGLEQAGAYIEEELISFREYRHRWRESRAKVLEWFDEQRSGYPCSVAVTWQTSMNQLDRSGLTMLRLGAMLAPDAIPVELFQTVAAVESFGLTAAILGSGAIDSQTGREPAARDGLLQLRRYALARPDGLDTIAIHRLVQEVTASRLSCEQRDFALSWLSARLPDFAPSNPFEPHTWERWDRLWPHFSAVWRSVADRADSQAHLDVGERLASYLFGKAKYLESEAVHATLLAVAERVTGPESREVAHILTGLAESRRCLDRFGPDLTALYERSLAIERRLHGQRSLRAASALNYLGLSYKHHARAEAEAAYREAIDIHESNPGQSIARLAMVLDNLAVLLVEDARNTEALVFSKRAIQCARSVPGHPHTYLCHLLRHHSRVWAANNDLVEAEKAARESLEVAVRDYGPHHSFTVSSREELADRLQAAGKTEAAVEQRYLAFEACCRAGCAPGAGILSGLFDALSSCGRFVEAEAVQKWTLASLTSNAAEDSLEFVLELNTHAISLRGLGRYTEALAELRRAIEIESRILPPDHPKHAHRRNNLAVVLMLDSKWEEAAAVCAESWRLKVRCADGHDVTSLRILITAVGLQFLRGRDASICIGQMRTLLSRGVLPCYGDISPQWTATDVRTWLQSRLRDDEFAFLTALMDVFNNPNALTCLDNHALWIAQTAVDLDVEWAS